MHPSIYQLPKTAREEKFESDQIGKRRERAFIHAWSDMLNWPPWMVRAPTKANEIENQAGIDVHVHTDIGPIPVQIKGSVASCKDYFDRRGPNGVTTVIVSHTDSVENIRASTLKHLKKGYEIAKHRLLKSRRGKHPHRLATR